MLRQQDAEGKYPLKSDEYLALLWMYACLVQYETWSPKLRERAKISGLMTWCDSKLIGSKLGKIITELMDTVPEKKRRAMREEMKITHMLLSPTWEGAKREAVYVVPEEDLQRLLNILVSQECWACEKTYKECKKCQIWKTVLGCLPFEDHDEKEDGLCPMAGQSQVFVWEDEDEKS